MNAAETIQAAIDKLMRLRAEASPGPWVAWKKPMSTLYRTDLVKYGLEDVRGADLFEAQSPENAQLLETLHATIDAQLLIMRNELAEIEIDKEASGFERPPHHDVFMLARSILGDRVDA